MAHRDVVVVGASAGGVEALQRLLAGIPAGFPAAIIVVTHLPMGGNSFLASVLSRAGDLPAAEAEDGETIDPGRIYVAPPGYHLLVGRKRLHLGRGPKEGRQRPSINVTFRSAARSYGQKAIAIVLSGMLDDGTAGAWEIKRQGGVVMVQDPDDSDFPSMPASVLEEVTVDFRLPAADMGRILADLVETVETEGEDAEATSASGAPGYSALTCPQCHGPLREGDDGEPSDFYCEAGHTFASQTLLDEHASTEERKLYEARIALQEGADLAEFLAAGHVNGATRDRMLAEAEQLREHVRALRKVIEERGLALTMKAEAD